jgi:hypothetical protein
MQVPAMHLLAALPQSASMQQSVAAMHAPLQSFSPATEQDVTRPSWVEFSPESRDLRPEPP